MRVKLLHPRAKVPTYATPGSGGADLYAALDAEMVVESGERVTVPTGIAIELGPDEVAYITGRSGLFRHHGMMCATGTIDSDYRGECGVMLINVTMDPITIKPGDRIAQLVVMPVRRPEFRESEELGETVRGSSGFGSSGR